MSVKYVHSTCRCSTCKLHVGVTQANYMSVQHKKITCRCSTGKLQVLAAHVQYIYNDTNSEWVKNWCQSAMSNSWRVKDQNLFNSRLYCMILGNIWIKKYLKAKELLVVAGGIFTKGFNDCELTTLVPAPFRWYPWYHRDTSVGYHQ